MLIRWLLLLLSIFPILSCGDSEDSTLAIAVSPFETFLLPGNLDIADGCYGLETFSENHLSFNKMEVQWTGEGTFLPIVVTIVLANGTDEQSCTLTDNESLTLGEFLGFGADEIDNSSGDGVEAESLCALRCGGFQSEENTTFVTQIKLIGIQTTTDSEGNDVQKPVSATTSVRVKSLEL